MKTRTLVFAVTLLSGCFAAPDDPPVDSGLLPFGGGAGSTGGDAGGGSGATRCIQISGSNDVVCAPLSPVVCGGLACASGEVCCQTTGACVAPGSVACPKPPTTTGNARACGSNSDCATDQYCVPDDYRPVSGRAELRCIGGSGHCQFLAFCGSCGGSPERCQVCGCNGVTYSSPQVACVAGVWAANDGACGVPVGHDGGAFTIPCGTAAQCPANAQCCFRTGKCFDASEPWRCAVQPNGSTLNCASHGECNPPSGAGGGSGSANDSRLCAADGCGGPGICGGRGSTSSCGGEVQPVCGCDEVTYVNACWARAAGARVASNGVCP